MAHPSAILTTGAEQVVLHYLLQVVPHSAVDALQVPIRNSQRLFSRWSRTLCLDADMTTLQQCGHTPCILPVAFAQ